MLLVMMYHRISYTRYDHDIDQFSAHLRYLAKNFPIVVPGEKLHGAKPQICLTFDDAYVDFYHTVFPLLKELNIKAVLAVPVKYILPSTKLDIDTRLSVPQPQAMNAEVYQDNAPFCTWQELKTMADSGLVKMASHSYDHISLTDENCDHEKEIIESKKVLQQQLNQDIDTFVYPCGRMSRYTHEKVRQHYDFAMRIGSACNKNWAGKNGLLYRVDADHFWPQSVPISNKQLAKFYLKYLINRIRGK